MKIKQIELIGFKSFSEKTLLPLHEGITCIVGPNGCGKSNIVDAFRWVLGEQSAKSLRGEKMEEVIFQGSATQRPKAMAEVSLSLTLAVGSNVNNNGSDGTLADDRDHKHAADNVFVARRLYRSGESEYLLNKRICRLKDIRDILLDTGLDVKSYSILDQHKISDIVNSRPQDRRILIEEIAGVMKYKLRKAEAQSKLESSRQNLLRINDIIQERRRQIGSIDRQARKAERYKRLLTEAQDLELRIARFKHSLLEVELQGLNNEIERIRGQEASAKSLFSEMQNKAETKKIELSERQRALSEFEHLLQSKERELASAEKRYAVLKTHIDNRRVEIARLVEQAHETEARRREAMDKAASGNINIGELQHSIDDLGRRAQGQSERLASLLGQLEAKEGVLENQRRGIFRLSDEVSTKKNELSKRHSHLEHLDYREEVAQRDRANIQQSIESLKKTVANMESQLQQLISETTEIERERQLLAEAIKTKEKTLSGIKVELAAQREALASEASRLDSIREMFAENSALRGSALRLLSDMVIADRQYETALEALLSEKIASPIVESRQAVIDLLSLIRDNSSARTSILYRHSDPDVVEGAPFPPVVGLIGRASDFIMPSGQDAGVAVFLKNELANTFVIDRPEPALEYIEQHKTNDIAFVTPQGDVITSRGWISTGRGSEVLRFKREQRELEASIKDRWLKIKELEDAISTAVTELAEMRDRVSHLHGIVADRDKKQSLLRHNLEDHQRELQRKLRRMESLEMEFASIKSEKDAVLTEIDKMAADIRQREQKRDELQQDIASVQGEINALREQLHVEREVETALRLELTSLSERLEASKREQRSLEQLTVELARNLEAISKNRETVERQIGEELLQMANLEVKIKEHLDDITALSSDYKRQKEDISGQYELIEAIEGSMKGIRTEIDDLASQLSDINKAAIEKRLAKENIEGSIREKYGFELSSIEVDAEVSEEDERRLQELQDKMREMGPVNLDSISEYEELKKGYDFLIKQQEDLNLSITELEEAINRINATTKRRLREAYNALREKFNSVFSTLFGGGKADLLLTDENNILEAGLEIIGQPPGKKNQSLNQLSGGEKALTSLALLFAGFLIKPSPLCILDEADAPLDESNTERFTAMIRNLSKDTQFIIITHNRVTMEIADYLYGITMEEPGVSKSISLQFADYDKAMN